MSVQTYVIYDKYNGHIVCDIKDNYRIFDNAVKAEQYIRDKNLNQIDFVVERRISLTAKEYLSQGFYLDKEINEKYLKLRN